MRCLAMGFLVSAFSRRRIERRGLAQAQEAISPRLKRILVTVRSLALPTGIEPVFSP